MRWAISSDLGSTTTQQTMVNLNVYQYTPASNTYIYACSNDEVSIGYVGVFFFQQTTANALPTPMRSFLLGTNTDPSDYNMCKAVYGRPTTPSSSSSPHTMYAFLQMRVPQNPLLVQINIQSGSYSVNYFTGQYNIQPGLFSLVMARFNSANGRIYYVGYTMYTLQVTSSQVAFTQFTGYADTLDTQISCSSQTSVGASSQPAFTTQNPAQFTSVSPTLTFTINTSQNNFGAILNDVGVVQDSTILASNDCPIVSPTIVLTYNTVVAPIVPGTTIQFVVGAPSITTTINDFTVTTCGSGTTTLSYSVTTSPSILQNSVSVSKNTATGMLQITVFTSDSSLVGLYSIIIKASLTNGQFSTITLSVQVSTNCVAAGIQISIGSPPAIPAAKVNITSMKILSGAQNYIEGSNFYQQILPYQILPFACGYSLTYTFALSTGGPLPSYITFDPSNMRFVVNIATNNVASMIGTYKIRVIVTANNTKSTQVNTGMWTLQLQGVIPTTQVVNIQPHFSSNLTSLQVAFNNSLNYTFPDIVSADSVTLSADLGEAASFTTFVKVNTAYILQVLTPSISGTYQISLTLSGNSFQQQYSMQIEVLNSTAQSSNQTGNNSTSKQQTPPVKSDPNFSATITSISMQGQVVIIFNQPIVQIADPLDVLSSDTVLNLSVAALQKNGVLPVISSWNVTDFEVYTMTLQVNFQNPEYVSMLGVRVSILIALDD